MILAASAEISPATIRSGGLLRAIMACNLEATRQAGRHYLPLARGLW
jgi:hypothetical protein